MRSRQASDEVRQGTCELSELWPIGTAGSGSPDRPSIAGGLEPETCRAQGFLLKFADIQNGRRGCELVFFSPVSEAILGLPDDIPGKIRRRRQANCPKLYVRPLRLFYSTSCCCLDGHSYIFSPTLVSDSRIAVNIVGVLYATTLALTLEVLYQRFMRIQERATNEASLLSQITRNLLTLFASEPEWAIDSCQMVANQIHIILSRTRGVELLSIMKGNVLRRFCDSAQFSL